MILKHASICPASAQAFDDLVKEAIQSIPYALNKVKMFHSDRGKEFDNQLIDELLEVFGITRSLRQPDCPYDNAVAESTYRSFNKNVLGWY